MMIKSLTLSTTQPMHLSELRRLIEQADHEAMSPDSSVTFRYPEEDHLIEVVVTDASETA